jgi:hypothetical protein
MKGFHTFESILQHKQKNQKNGKNILGFLNVYLQNIYNKLKYSKKSGRSLNI